MCIFALCPQQEFWAWELRISRVFFKFDGGFNFFENVKKTEQLRAPFSSAITENEKNGFFLVFGYFWQKYWSQGDQISPSLSHQYYLLITYKYYAFLTNELELGFVGSIVQLHSDLLQRRVDCSEDLFWRSNIVKKAAFLKLWFTLKAYYFWCDCFNPLLRFQFERQIGPNKLS